MAFTREHVLMHYDTYYFAFEVVFEAYRGGTKVKARQVGYGLNSLPDTF